MLVALVMSVAGTLAMSGQAAETGSTPEARLAMAAFGQCVARSSPDKSHDLLTQDFRTPSYRAGLRALAENNRECLKIRGKMRATGLPFAAAVAESLLKVDPAPLHVRLAKAAGNSNAQAYAPSDVLAMCVARSSPNETAALFATPVATDAEKEAVAKLSPAAALCSAKVGRSMALEPFAVRSVLATARYRHVAASRP